MSSSKSVDSHCIHENVKVSTYIQYCVTSCFSLVSTLNCALDSRCPDCKVMGSRILVLHNVC